MKKENMSLILNAVIITLLTIGLIFGYKLLVPTGPEDYLFGQAVTLGEEEVITNVPAFGNYTIVNTVQDAYNLAGDKIGTVYNVKAVYTYFNVNEPGYIELLVGIDSNNQVTVRIIDLEQTVTYTSGIQNYVFEYFQGFGTDQLILIPVVNLEDVGAGATASSSTGKVKELISLAIEYHVTHTLSLSEVNQG